MAPGWYVQLDGDQLVVTVPRTAGVDRAHTVRFATDYAGMTSFLKALASYTIHTRIGEPGAPTQHGVTATQILERQKVSAIAMAKAATERGHATLEKKLRESEALLAELGL